MYKTTQRWEAEVGVKVTSTEAKQRIAKYQGVLVVVVSGDS